MTAAGKHMFLEVDPADQFLFMEQGAGLPIADAIAGRLAGAGQRAAA